WVCARSMSPRAMQSKATWASCVAAWSSRDASSRAGLPFSVSASVITVYLPVYDWLGPRGVQEYRRAHERLDGPTVAAPSPRGAHPRDHGLRLDLPAPRARICLTSPATATSGDTTHAT